MEILITGFGGQGIVLAGQIVGKAASLIDHKESTLTQSYGPEARGGSCSAQVIISDGFIHFPYVRQPDILVCMSQGGFDKYAGHDQGDQHSDRRSESGKYRQMCPAAAALPFRQRAWPRNWAGR